MQNAFLRRNWRRLLIVALLAIVIAPLAFMLPEHQRWFLLGVWPTAILGILTHYVIVASGAARLVMADQGEQWTRQELKTARKRGWKVVHRVLFRRYGDIDTIALGPAGVVVIETKWSSEDWTSPKQQAWLDAAVAQAAKNAALVERQVRQAIGPSPTWPVVVLWPSDAAVGVRDVQGVTVLPGLELRRWIRSLPHGVFPPEQVDAAWAFLERHVAKRDAHDFAVDGPMPRSPLRYLTDMLLYPVGALIGALLVSVLIREVGWPLMLLPAALVLGAGVWASRFAPVRRMSLAGALTIAGMLSALVAIESAAHLVR